MDLEEGLETFLWSNESVGGLVRSGTGTSTRYRIYPRGKVPQNPAFPYVSYQRISTEDVMAMEGYNNLSMARIQVDAWAATNRSARALANAIRDLLRGYRGVMGSVEVLACLPLDRAYLPEPATSGAETGVERIRQDWMISYREQ